MRWLVTRQAICSVLLVTGGAGCHTPEPAAVVLQPCQTAQLPDSVAPEDAVVAQVDGAPTVDSGSDTDAQSAEDTPISPSDAPSGPEVTPVCPMQVSGKFANLSAKFGGPLNLDPGKKSNKKEPAASSGAFVDADNDGVLDLLVSDGMDQVWLAQAKTPWEFGAHIPLKLNDFGASFVGFTDADADGIPELLVGTSKIHLFVRQKNGSYVDVAEDRGLSVATLGSVQAVVPADIDNDGLLDLLGALHTCDDSGRIFAWMNQGNGTYLERAQTYGILQKSTLWQILATDVDGDRDVDLMSMHEDCPPLTGNAFFRNGGVEGPAKIFTQQVQAPVFNAPDPAGGTPMGATVGDVDRDGRLDYMFTAIGFRDAQQGGMDMTKPDLKMLALDTSGTHLILQQPDGSWQDIALQAGISVPLSADGQVMVGWSARLWDFDGDGYLDLLVNHGYDWPAFILGDEQASRPVLFHNQCNLTFSDVSQAVGLVSNHVSRAMAMADVDGDGDLDVFMGGQTEQPMLLRNDIVSQNQWLTVTLHGKVSNVWGLGSRLELQTNKRTYVAEMSLHAPTATLMQPVVHFGIPAGEKVQQLTVKWPSGFDSQVQVTAANQHVQISEPPLVTLSARFAVTNATEKVLITVQAFDTVGKPVKMFQNPTLELAPGALGKFAGGLLCDDSGVCTRTWIPPSGNFGEDALIVTIGGKPLSVRPKIHYSGQ